jgi:hypothetical protein
MLAKPRVSALHYRMASDLLGLRPDVLIKEIDDLLVGVEAFLRIEEAMPFRAFENPLWRIAGADERTLHGFGVAWRRTLVLTAVYQQHRRLDTAG